MHLWKAKFAAGNLHGRANSICTPERDSSQAVGSPSLCYDSCTNQELQPDDRKMGMLEDQGSVLGTWMFEVYLWVHFVPNISSPLLQ